MVEDKYHARSNHGLRYPDAGYTLGENAKALVRGFKKVLDLMPQISCPEDLIHGLYEQRGKDFNSPHNVVRRTDDVRFTGSQLIYDSDEKKILFILSLKIAITWGMRRPLVAMVLGDIRKVTRISRVSMKTGRSRLSQSRPNPSGVARHEDV